MRELLCDLINATLTGRPLRIEGVTEEEWQYCFELALQQQVLAMTFPSISTLPKEQRPGFLLWSKWMAYSEGTARQQAQKSEALKKIGLWLSDKGLSTMVIKGFSLAVLYPNPNLREFCDVDIYSGKDYEAVNDCLERHGITMGKTDGHHGHLKVDGVSVEHHFALHNSRVSRGMQGPIEALQWLATTGLQATSLPCIYFPNAVFTALFTVWHAHKHFLHEKIELRHVVDWALALRQLTAEEDEEVSKVKGASPWGRFADAMTAIALHRLVLPQEWFPTREVEAASHISHEQEERVWNDIIGASHIAQGGTTLRRRIMIGQRLMKNRWKFKEYADVSAERFLWKEFVGYMKNRKV